MLDITGELQFDGARENDDNRRKHLNRALVFICNYHIKAGWARHPKKNGGLVRTLIDLEARKTYYSNPPLTRDGVVEMVSNPEFKLKNGSRFYPDYSTLPDKAELVQGRCVVDSGSNVYAALAPARRDWTNRFPDFLQQIPVRRRTD